MFNRAEIIGNLGADPETRYSQGGTAITQIRVATMERWRDKRSGEQQERTEWHNVTAFGRLAEIMGEYLHKGSQVFIAGRLQTDSWEKDGVKRYMTKIIASELKMLGGRQQQNGRQQTGGHQQREPDTRHAGGPTLPEDDFDDDIPF